MLRLHWGKRASTWLGLDPRLRSPVERGEAARPLALRSAELHATELSGVTALAPAQRGAARFGAVV